LFTATLDKYEPLKTRWAGLAARQSEALTMQARHWEVGNVSTAEITSDLETMVMFTGDNDAAARLAGLITASPRTIDSPRLAVAAATIMSLTNPEASRDLLRLAGSLCGDPLSKAMVGLRLVAVSIKRLPDHERAMALIRELGKLASAGTAHHVISDADAGALRALLLNLRALLEVREDRLHDAVASMNRAATVMPEDGFVRVPIDMADRYRAQVRVNVAQALWLAGRESEAVGKINEHASITRTEHPYSLSEALLVAAYFNEVAGNHAISMSYCLESERLLIREGAPSRLAMCRRIAVAALDGSGKTRRAEKLARALVHDPGGERFLV
jgi:hypothetical protein